MSQSLTLTNVQAYQDHVKEVSGQLYREMFLKNKTSGLAQKHLGVKGEKVLTQLILTNLVRRWSGTFDPLANAADLKPRTITTKRVKVDLAIVPQELEESYLGEFLSRGQDPHDFPFQAYFFEGVVAQVAAEIEKAQWQAVETGSPLATDTLLMMFDGLLHQIEDQITATDLSPYASGAWNSTNALTHLEAMYKLLDDRWKDGEIVAYMAPDVYQDVVVAAREIHKYTNPDMRGEFRLDFGNCKAVPVPGMVGKKRVIMTPRFNMNYALDAPMDQSLIRMEWEVRTMKLWMDFRIGMKWLYDDDASGAMIVNDQT